MNFISPVLSAKFETQHSIRQRQISKSSDNIASGDRLSSNPSINSAAFRISERLKTENKLTNSARKNLENAYTLAQHQADIMSHAENIIKRMNTLAYEATDPISSDHDREILDHEFQEHSKTLESLMFDRTFNNQLLDPQAADYIDKTIVYPDEETASGAYSKKIDISSIGAKVRLWWNSYDSRDRIQLKQGNELFFDSGEYLSDTGSGIRSEVVDGQTIYGDYFEIDIQPNQVSYVSAPDNKGDANFSLAPGYPQTLAPSGESTTIEITVNEPGPEGIIRTGPINWSWAVSISPEQIGGPQGIIDEKGGLYELAPLGFSTLKGYTINSRTEASLALERSGQELESVRNQIYTLAKTFSEIQIISEKVNHKIFAQEVAIGRIKDANIASEYTNLAKNLLLQEVNNQSIIHSRMHADRILKLIS